MNGFPWKMHKNSSIYLGICAGDDVIGDTSEEVIFMWPKSHEVTDCISYTKQLLHFQQLIDY